MTLHEYIKKNPDRGKWLLFHREYFTIRLFLLKEISRIESSVEGTRLSADAGIKDLILPTLRQKVYVLEEYFERAGQSIDPMACAKFLLELEEKTLKGDYKKACRYYKGENYADGMFENYEQKWIVSHKNDRNCLASDLLEYLQYGLWDFSEQDGVPMSLKAILWNRYCHWNYSHHGFKEWYKREYLK